MIKLQTKKGKKFRCFKKEGELNCVAVGNPNRNDTFLCKATQSKFVEFGRLIGKISTTLLSTKFPPIASLSTISDELIDKGADALHRFNLNHCQ